MLEIIDVLKGIIKVTLMTIFGVFFVVILVWKLLAKLGSCGQQGTSLQTIK